MPLQNSRDNMSAVLVTFPSAPKVSQEAIEKVQNHHVHTLHVRMQLHLDILYSCGMHVNFLNFSTF